MEAKNFNYEFKSEHKSTVLALVVTTKTQYTYMYITRAPRISAWSHIH